MRVLFMKICVIQLKKKRVKIDRYPSQKIINYTQKNMKEIKREK